MRAFQRFRSFLVALFGLLLLGCASTPEETAPTKVLVVLHNYQTGQSFELASESHTERVAYYSSERSDAARKVQTDAVMLALVEEFQRLDYGAHARPGKAPGTAPESTRWALALSSSDKELNWTIGTGDSRETWLAFQKCRDSFLQLYNVTTSFQTVQNEQGRGYFQDVRPGSSPK